MPGEFPTPGSLWQVTKRLFRSLWQATKHVFTFVRTNTGFVTLLLSIVIGGWASWRYGVGPFEDKENIATRKASADTYTRIGDQLLLNGEFLAAKGAYQKALDINPNNVRAMHGLVSTEVFDPLAGHDKAVPEVADIRLEQLKSLLDHDEHFIIPYLEGIRYEDQDNYPEAEKRYEAAIQENPEFIRAYLAKAYVSIFNKEGIGASLETLERVPEAKRMKQPPILANLGFCYLARDVVNKDVSKAIEKLEKSLTISPYLETYLDLGDAHRYMGDIELALENHQKAFALVGKDENEKENSVFGDLAINLMPTASADKTKTFVKVTTMAEKRMLAYYALSFDYALLGQWQKANQAFESGFQLDETHKYNEFIVNKIESIKDFSKKPLKPPARNWLNGQIKRLPFKVVTE